MNCNLTFLFLGREKQVYVPKKLPDSSVVFCRFDPSALKLLCYTFIGGFLHTLEASVVWTPDKLACFILTWVLLDSEPWKKQKN